MTYVAGVVLFVHASLLAMWVRNAAVRLALRPSGSDLRAMLLFGWLLCPVLTQPTAPIALFRAGSPEHGAYSSVNGGRDWSVVPLSTGSNWSIGFSSVTGGASLLFQRDPAPNSTLQTSIYNPNALEWEQYPTGLRGVAPYLGAVSINRGAWLAAVDDVGGTRRVFTWTSGAIPFYEVHAASANTACGLRMGAMAVLPSGALVAAAATAPFGITLWRASGCAGSLDLAGGPLPTSALLLLSQASLVARSCLATPTPLLSPDEAADADGSAPPG